jgi:hypothetical protein
VIKLKESEPNMSVQESFPLHKGETAVVKRVVPGRLVYVAKKGASDDSLFGFKLDHLIIRELDGSNRPYRGALSDLGITSGRYLTIGEKSEEDGEPTLVVNEPRKDLTRGIATAISTATAISNAVANTIIGAAKRR